MLCDLDMVVVFGKYRCVLIMEADQSSKALGEETFILLISLQDHNQPCAYLQKLHKASSGIDDLVMQA